MRELNQIEMSEVNGAGWLKFLLPVAIGFVWGGPAGALAVAGTIIATTGVENLEHLHDHNQVRSFDEIIR
jgi:hypothetical protein